MALIKGLPRLPQDLAGQALTQSTPRAVALATTVIAVEASQKITLNADTTFIRVMAVAQDIYLRWARTDVDYASASNFDEIIPAGQYCDFGVPAKVDGTRYTDIHLVGRVSGATAIVIEK